MPPTNNINKLMPWLGDAAMEVPVLTNSDELADYLKAIEDEIFQGNLDPLPSVSQVQASLNNTCQTICKHIDRAENIFDKVQEKQYIRSYFTVIAKKLNTSLPSDLRATNQLIICFSHTGDEPETLYHVLWRIKKENNDKIPENSLETLKNFFTALARIKKIIPRLANHLNNIDDQALKNQFKASLNRYYQNIISKNYANVKTNDIKRQQEILLKIAFHIERKKPKPQSVRSVLRSLNNELSRVCGVGIYEVLLECLDTLRELNSASAILAKLREDLIVTYSRIYVENYNIDQAWERHVPLLLRKYAIETLGFTTSNHEYALADDPYDRGEVGRAVNFTASRKQAFEEFLVQQYTYTDIVDSILDEKKGNLNNIRHLSKYSEISNSLKLIFTESIKQGVITEAELYQTFINENYDGLADSVIEELNAEPIGVLPIFTAVENLLQKINMLRTPPSSEQLNQIINDTTQNEVIQFNKVLNHTYSTYKTFFLKYWLQLSPKEPVINLRIKLLRKLLTDGNNKIIQAFITESLQKKVLSDYEAFNYLLTSFQTNNLFVGRKIISQHFSQKKTAIHAVTSNDWLEVMTLAKRNHYNDEIAQLLDDGIDSVIQPGEALILRSWLFFNNRQHAQTSELNQQKKSIIDNNTNMLKAQLESIEAVDLSHPELQQTIENICIDKDLFVLVCQNKALIHLLKESFFKKQLSAFSQNHCNFDIYTKTYTDKKITLFRALLNSQSSIHIEIFLELYSPAVYQRVDDKGNTGLHVAVREENYNLIYIFLKNNAPIYSRNYDNFTPLALAFKSNNITLTAFLLENNKKRNNEVTDTLLKAMQHPNDEVGYTHDIKPLGLFNKFLDLCLCDKTLSNIDTIYCLTQLLPYALLTGKITIEKFLAIGKNPLAIKIADINYPNFTQPLQYTDIIDYTQHAQSPTLGLLLVVSYLGITLQDTEPACFMEKLKETILTSLQNPPYLRKPESHNGHHTTSLYASLVALALSQIKKAQLRSPDQAVFITSNSFVENIPLEKFSGIDYLVELFMAFHYAGFAKLFIHKLASKQDPQFKAFQNALINEFIKLNKFDDLYNIITESPGLIDLAVETLCYKQQHSLITKLINLKKEQTPNTLIKINNAATNALANSCSFDNINAVLNVFYLLNTSMYHKDMTRRQAVSILRAKNIDREILSTIITPSDQQNLDQSILPEAIDCNNSFEQLFDRVSMALFFNETITTSIDEMLESHKTFIDDFLTNSPSTTLITQAHQFINEKLDFTKRISFQNEQATKNYLVYEKMINSLDINTLSSDINKVDQALLKIIPRETKQSFESWRENILKIVTSPNDKRITNNASATTFKALFKCPTLEQQARLDLFFRWVTVNQDLTKQRVETILALHLDNLDNSLKQKCVAEFIEKLHQKLNNSDTPVNHIKAIKLFFKHLVQRDEFQCILTQDSLSPTLKLELLLLWNSDSHKDLLTQLKNHPALAINFYAHLTSLKQKNCLPAKTHKLITPILKQNIRFLAHQNKNSTIRNSAQETPIFTKRPFYKKYPDFHQKLAISLLILISAIAIATLIGACFFPPALLIPKIIILTAASLTLLTNTVFNSITLKRTATENKKRQLSSQYNLNNNITVDNAKTIMSLCAPPQTSSPPKNENSILYFCSQGVKKKKENPTKRLSFSR